MEAATARFEKRHPVWLGSTYYLAKFYREKRSRRCGPTSVEALKRSGQRKTRFFGLLYRQFQDRGALYGKIEPKIVRNAFIDLGSSLSTARIVSRKQRPQ